MIKMVLSRIKRNQFYLYILIDKFQLVQIKVVSNKIILILVFLSAATAVTGEVIRDFPRREVMNKWIGMGLYGFMEEVIPEKCRISDKRSLKVSMYG